MNNRPRSKEVSRSRVLASASTDASSPLRTVTQPSRSPWQSARQRLHNPRVRLLAIVLLLAIITAPLAFAYEYAVQPGDTLSRIAKDNGTTVEALVEANNIANPNVIFIGQTLEIPEQTASTSASPSIAFALVNVPNTPATSQINPTVSANKTCMRFNLETGRNASTGSLAGVYILYEKTAGAKASWQAKAGQVDSLWINDLEITYPSVHVSVLFYPENGATPVQMEIVNHAPDSTYGWLTRGRCHAIEIQYPAGY